MQLPLAPLPTCLGFTFIWYTVPSRPYSGLSYLFFKIFKNRCAPAHPPHDLVVNAGGRVDSCALPQTSCGGELFA
jgi:hypothetical protein